MCLTIAQTQTISGSNVARGRHQKLYSVIAITLRYIFALSHNASTLRRKVVASYCYRSGLIEIVIVSYSYRSGSVGIALAHNSYCFKVINYRFLHRSPFDNYSHTS
jgi:hypothetical protein